MSSNNNELKAAFKHAFIYTTPILTGFFISGMAYGLLMQKSGYGVLWTFLMSAIAFCGSMQFLAVALLSSFDPIQAFLLSLMVNARHLFYAIPMLPKYKELGKTKYLLIYVLCDETFSVLTSIKPAEHINKKYFYVCFSLLNYSYWIIAGVLGALLGSLIEFNIKGLDFVLTALFLVLFLEQAKNGLSYGLIGIFSAIAALLIFGAQHMIIPSMIIILVCLIAKAKLWN